MCAVAAFLQTPAQHISLRAEGERACTAIRRVVPGDGNSILPYNLSTRGRRLVVEVRVAHEAEAAVLAVRRDGGVERLSSEIKDEISSKLASALRALKSRISRICGINELERRIQNH